MQIVINIPEDDYEYLKNHNKHGLYSSILNGTPLPKGHGRLIDLNDLYDFDRRKVEYAPTIIEADKVESEE